MSTQLTGRNGPTLSIRMLVFFAANPEEVLTADDVLLKFECEPTTLREAADKMELRGYIRRVTQRSRSRQFSVFSAGPLLLEMLGRPSENLMEARHAV